MPINSRLQGAILSPAFNRPVRFAETGLSFPMLEGKGSRIDRIEPWSCGGNHAQQSGIPAIENNPTAKQAAALADEAAVRADEGYSAGTGDVLTLIEVTHRQIDSASQYATIRRMRLGNRVDLHLAPGGGFSAGR